MSDEDTSNDLTAALVEAIAEEAEGDGGLSHGSHMIAGAAAGVAEHTCMFPVDLVKTRMQVHTASGVQPYRSASEAFRVILRTEGAWRLWRGVPAMAAGAAPSHAAYFAVYEIVKDHLGGNEPGTHVMATATGGALGTMVSDAILTPWDAVKQRMQMQNSPYSGVLNCIRVTLQQEGIGALYAGYRTTLFMNVPFFTVQFGTYELFKKTLRTDGSSEEDESVLSLFATHLGAGGGAGAMAAAATNPLDVCKTRLQTMGVSGKRYDGMVDALRTIHAEEGMKGLFKGLRPRMLFHIPSAALCWTVYELAKMALHVPDSSTPIHQHVV